MIDVKQSGDFRNLEAYFAKSLNSVGDTIFQKYGEMGVEALKKATPVATGETASSWRYKIDKNQNGVTLEFHNDHMINGANIAILLQYGHGTRNGGWVSGRDYINPAIQPIFDQMAKELAKEVTSQ